MKLKFFLFVLFFPFYSVLAQLDYSLSGYVVDLPVFALDKDRPAFFPTGDKQMFINLTRIRLRPEINLWSNARINYEHEIDFTYSKSSSDFLFNTININRQIANLRWNVLNEKNIKLTHYIDRLSFRQAFDWGNITIGRQRIAWGSGRVWNPTDLFNPINPANYSKSEKDGADAVLLNYYFGDFTNLEVVYNPLKDKEGNAGCRFRTNFNEFDVAAVGGYFDKRIIGGLDFAGNLFNAGVRGEGIISVNKNDASDKYIKFILGADNQFTPEFYAMIEYHYNGEGKTNKIYYELLRLLNGQILNLSRNYIVVSASYIFSPLVTLSVTDNINLNDGSGFIGMISAYSAGDNFYLNIGAQLTYGSEYTEYWYYPNSLYLQGEYYF